MNGRELSSAAPWCRGRYSSALCMTLVTLFWEVQYIPCSAKRFVQSLSVKPDDLRSERQVLSPLQGQTFSDVLFETH